MYGIAYKSLFLQFIWNTEDKDYFVNLYIKEIVAALCQ